MQFAVRRSRVSNATSPKNSPLAALRYRADMSALQISTSPKSMKNISRPSSPAMMTKSPGAACSGVRHATSDEMNEVSAFLKKGTLEIMSLCR